FHRSSKGEFVQLPAMWPPSSGGARGRLEPLLASPGRPLQDHAIAVGVFEGEPVAIPIGIEGRDGREARIAHALYRGPPAVGVGQIEDNQVVGGGRPARLVAARAGELEM